MLYSLIPDYILTGIKNINLSQLSEIRLRVGAPIMVNVSGENKFLTLSGAEKNHENAIICKNSTIDYVLQVASNQSLYTINDQLIQGYITVKGGIRIGVAGEVVTVNGTIKTIKNITSLNIRVPHEIKNCSLNAYLYLTKGNFPLNTLVLSPAGAGKTTFIRDFAYQISKRNKKINILIVDERSEITGISNGIMNLNTGNVDVICNSKKKFAFENGIRSLKPDVIITDELNLTNDLIAIENAISSGVKVIATIHASNINDLKNKFGFCELLSKKLFERFVVLSENSGPGTLEGVYNDSLSCIYCG